MFQIQTPVEFIIIGSNANGASYEHTGQNNVSLLGPGLSSLISHEKWHVVESLPVNETSILSTGSVYF